MTTTDEERELRELFAPRRPDPDAFAAGVAAKIRARAEAATSVQAGETGTQRGGLLQRAASVLPFDLGLGAATAAKSIWAWLSLPMLLVGGAIAAFAGSVLVLRSSSGTAHPAARRKPSFTLAHLTCYALVACPVLLLLAAPSAPDKIVDAMLGGAILSMCALTVVLYGAARLGYTERTLVATLCMQVLNGVWFGGGFFVLSSDALYGEALYKGVAGTWIVLGMLALAPLVARRLWPLVAIALLTLVFLVPDALGPHRPSAADLAEAVANSHPAPDDLIAWQHLGAMHEALRACGIATAPSAAQRAAVAAALATADVHPVVLTAAAQLGIVSDEQWQQLAARPGFAHDMDQLERLDAPLQVVGYNEWLLSAWLAARAPDPTAREHVLARIERSWPAPDTELPLQRTMLFVRWLDRLGRTDLVAEHSEWLRTMLARHQASTDEPGPGGFGEFPARRLGAADESTHRALALLLRLGDAPIDHRALRRHLVRMAHTGSDLAAADLLWYRHAGHVTHRGPGEFLVDERLFLGTVLLVLLCLIATYRAPHARASAGTLP